MNSDEDDLIRFAECILVHAKLAVLESEALVLLRDQPSLAMTRLWPASRVIQVVTLNGVHIGRIRLEDPRYEPEGWIAVPLAPSKAHGPYRSSMAAATSLVHKPSHRERIEP